MRKEIILAFLFIVCSINKGQSQAQFCEFLCTDDPNSVCFTCDLGADLPGFYENLQPDLGTPSNATPVCENYLTDNTLWMTFVAGSDEVDIDMEFSNCIGHPNLHSGIKLSCGGICIAMAGTCQSNNTMSSLNLSSDELIVGEVYSFFIDGCSGGTCDFEISVDHTKFELDLPSSISVYSPCDDDCYTSSDCSEFSQETNTIESIIVSPGEEVLFRPRHSGNSETDYDDYDSPGSFYPPELSATFEWLIDNQTITSGPEGITYDIPLPNKRTFTVCLNEISADNCNVSVNSNICIDVIVDSPEDEQFDFQVCAIDFIGGWDIPRDIDPNGDGVSWLGQDKFFLDEIEDWDNGCETFTFTPDPCDPSIEQTLCIDVLSRTGNKTYYMFDCQFNEGEYDWYWPHIDEIIEVNIDDFNSNFQVVNGSFSEDWENNTCDSLFTLTIENRELVGLLSKNDCAEEMTEYQFELDLSFQEDPNNLWPEIDELISYRWIDCVSQQVLQTDFTQDFSLFEVTNDIEVCIRAEISFENGIYINEDNREQVTCEQIFGPYLLTADCSDQTSVVTCPNFDDKIHLTINSITPQETCEVNPCTLEDMDLITISISEEKLPEGRIDWKMSENPNFDPATEGQLVGQSTINSNWKEGEQGPELLAINYRDPIYDSEYFIVGTGSGFTLNEMAITIEDNCGAECNPDCLRDTILNKWSKSNSNLITGCEEIIIVGDSDPIPPNSILIVFVDGYPNQFLRSAEDLCTLDGCVYVTFADMPQCPNVFADEGSASYTLKHRVHRSTLTYQAQPEGGAVNSREEYFFEPDILPTIYPTPIPINASVNDLVLSVSCDEFSGQQYLKGFIDSPYYNSECCSPYTPTYTFDITCEEVPPPPPAPVTGIFGDYIWLASLVDTTDCTGITIQVYQQGIYNYLHIQTLDTGTLYFQDGSQYCVDAQGFSCVSAYGLSNLIETWECNDGSIPPSNPNPVPEIFEEFPFLSNLIDTSNCAGTTVNVYESGVYSFIHIETSTSGVLYFQDGSLYCTDASNFSCIEAYGFGDPVMTWSCGGNTNSDLFIDYPWLGNLIDQDNCGNLAVQVYAIGDFLYLFVETEDGLMTMYNQDGDFYCQDATNFSCFSAYGFTSGDFVEGWECQGFEGGAPVEQRQQSTHNTKMEASLNIYPNPGLNWITIETNVEAYTLEIFDMQGRKMSLTQDLNRINIESYSSGIYLLVLNSNDVSLVQKIIRY